MVRVFVGMAAMIVSVSVQSGSSIQSSSIEGCSAFLPEGYEYELIIKTTIDRTESRRSMTGEISVLADANNDDANEFDQRPFVNCLMKFIKIENMEFL